jgi:exopolyphosphatase/pppGpp-phosphohydrolase
VSDQGTTSLALDAHRIILASRAAGEVVVAVGVEDLAAHFRHAPPTGAELEHAIDVIEDALTATRLGHASRGALTTRSALLRSLPGLAREGGSLSIDEVESLFQRLALAASGRSTALDGIPADRETAAALLVLRETMHHLGFDRVQV